MKLTVIGDYINNIGGIDISGTLWQRISEEVDKMLVEVITLVA
jgi:hypothetical protein